MNANEPRPEPTRDQLRLLTQRPLPAAQLVAAAKAQCYLDGRWWGVSTSTADRDDPEFVANAKTVVELAAIHAAAAG